MDLGDFKAGDFGRLDFWWKSAKLAECTLRIYLSSHATREVFWILLLLSATLWTVALHRAHGGTAENDISKKVSTSKTAKTLCECFKKLVLFLGNERAKFGAQLSSTQNYVHP